jgi:hypothetical protein
LGWISHGEVNILTFARPKGKFGVTTGSQNQRD